MTSTHSDGSAEPAPALHAVGPAPGGSLAQYGEYRRTLGETAVPGASGASLWVPGGRGELTRLPLFCTDPVDDAEARQLLRCRGAWVVSYLLSAEALSGANCFLYVCRDPQYHRDRLRKNARKVIKRGLRNFVVRRCSWDELAAKGHDAKAETYQRHGHAPPSREAFLRIIERKRHSPFHEAWGAWRGDDLAAWLTLIKVDNWAMFESSPSRSGALSLAPNNVLRYETLRCLLTEEKRAVVTTGVSGLLPDRAQHEYKTRIGFEALPVRRVFIPHPLIAPAMKTRVGRTILGWLLAARPQSSFLQRAAGVAKIVSGQDKAPLAWATGAAEAGNEGEADAEE